MDCNYLLKDELEFELETRGAYVKSSVPVLKNLLKKLLDVEKSGTQSYSIKAPRKSFEHPSAELDICSAKLDTLCGLVEEIEGKPDKVTFRRSSARLVHLKNRLNFAVPSNDFDESRKLEMSTEITRLLDILKKKDEIREVEKLTSDEEKVLNETLEKLGLGNTCEVDDLITIDNYMPSTSYSRYQNNRSPTNIYNQLDNGGKKLLRSSTLYYDDNGSTTNRKLVPISQWGVKFSGNHTASVNAFLERIYELKDARNASDNDLWRCAIDLFEGDALIWYRANKMYISNWQELVDLLKITFQHPFYQDSLLHEIKRRTQGQDESVTIFICILQNMFNRLPEPIPEKIKINIILKNLQPYYQKAICRDVFSSIAELTSVLRVIERTKISCDTFVEPTVNVNSLEPDLAYKKKEGNIGSLSSNYNVSSKINEIEDMKIDEISVNMRCWNCRQTGHIFRNCRIPKQRLFCYVCGKFGVISKDCGCKGNDGGENPKTAK